MSVAEAASRPSISLDPDWPETAARLLEQVRERHPRVHAVTNAAAQVLTANLLLAAGATPSLTIAPDEIIPFTTRADALLINLGTLDQDRRASIPWAIATARACGKPWVLDPVFVDASPPRLELARLCLAGQPSVLRCNRAEFAALAGEEPTAENVRAHAAAWRTTLALTGPVDWVSDGERFVEIRNGHTLMTRVTAIGCASAALIAALAATGCGAFPAAASALLLIGVAGEIAAETGTGPGSFQPALLDALYRLGAAEIRSRARLS